METNTKPVTCQVCNSPQVRDLWRGWVRCVACGSDSSPYEFDPSIYNAAFADNLYTHIDGRKFTRHDLIHDMTVNLDLFNRVNPPDKSFLDVGCCEGVSVDAPQLSGWDWYGWDRFQYPRQHSRVTVSEVVSCPRLVGAVMCREVIEHVPDPFELLMCIRALTLPGAWLQVQTPLPSKEESPMYDPQHLRLYSPVALTGLLWSTGWVVKGTSLEWETGQCVMAYRS